MTLERTRGNKVAAANLLGLYRPRLYTTPRKHNPHETIREMMPTSPEPETEGDEIEEAEPVGAIA